MKLKKSCNGKKVFPHNVEAAREAQVTCRLCRHTGLTKWEIELKRGNEILMRVFCATCDDDAKAQAKRGYPEYIVADCREVAQ